MIHVDQITKMQQMAIARWHRHGLDNPFSGFLAIACHQCSLNYLLWHEEDAARNPTASDEEIALIKRTIDQLNQQRNDYIELMDNWIAQALAAAHVQAAPDAQQNTETPGSAIDRLAILALRIYHLEEQLRRPGVDADHLQSVDAKLSTCRLQHRDLSRATGRLLADLFRGRKRHQLYRQFKMYNDPSLNPYLYQTVAWRQTSPDAAGGAADRAEVQAWPAAPARPSPTACHP